MIINVMINCWVDLVDPQYSHSYSINNILLMIFNGDFLWSPSGPPSQAPQFHFEAVLAPLPQIGHLDGILVLKTHQKWCFNQQ